MNAAAVAFMARSSSATNPLAADRAATGLSSASAKPAIPAAPAIVWSKKERRFTIRGQARLFLVFIVKPAKRILLRSVKENSMMAAMGWNNSRPSG
jgi:hypothetical protein